MADVLDAYEERLAVLPTDEAVRLLSKHAEHQSPADRRLPATCSRTWRRALTRHLTSTALRCRPST